MKILIRSDRPLNDVYLVLSVRIFLDELRKSRIELLIHLQS